MRVVHMRELRAGFLRANFRIYRKSEVVKGVTLGSSQWEKRI